MSEMSRTWWDGSDYRWLYDGPRQKWPGAYSFSGTGDEAAARRGWVELVAAGDGAAERRLKRIAGAHSKDVDRATGMSSGLCVECQLSWPCPTNVWASGSGRDPVLDCWDPNDDDEVE